jgi:hypothetical protein
MARTPDFHYSSQPSRTQTRGARGFYTGHGGDEVGERTHEYGERPHGWGNYESNYDLAPSEPRRVDASSREDHRGKGPQGYRRTDERMHELACELLTEDPRIDATHIDVHVQDGELTLTGFVDSRRTKYLVEELLARSVGEQIVNRLQVRRPEDTGPAREVARNWPVD